MKSIEIVCTGLFFLYALSGCNEPSLDRIKEKIVKIETHTQNYEVVNKKTGAYGKYQILPRTGKYYAQKLDIPVSEWRKPENQDRIFEAILEDNIKQLKKHGFEINAFTVYGCHQQGARGFVTIMKDQNLTEKFDKKLRRNLPKVYHSVDPVDLRETWINYWKQKVEEV